MNKYGSAIRTITARNIVSGQISPDYTVVINTGIYKQVFDSFRFDNIPASNFSIKNVGLFANYGKGLVLRYPSPRLLLAIRTAHITGSAPLLGTCSQTDDMVSGIGTFFTSLAVGDIIGINTSTNRLMFVRNIISDTSMQVSDYQTAPAGSIITRYAYVNDLACGSIRDINILNMTYSFEKFVPQAVITSLPSIVYGELNVPGNVEYLTTSVNQGYAGELVTLDVISDFEITAV